MIIDRAGSHFVFVLPRDHIDVGYQYINYRGKPLTNREYLESWGKWLVFGEAEGLWKLARALDPFVEERIVPGVKFDREYVAEFGLDRCVMCVYCHEKDREDVWEVLSQLGVQDRSWIFERETVERWMPGGVNLEAWIRAKGLDAQEADSVRSGAERMFAAMFRMKDAIFSGIEQ